MKIALVSAASSFGFSDVGDWMESLKAQIALHGHVAECITLPWVDCEPRLLQQLCAYRWVDLNSVADRVICLAGPAVLVGHAKKIILCADDLLGCVEDGFSERLSWCDAVKDAQLRRTLIDADRIAWGEAERVIATSPRQRERLLARYGRRSVDLQFPLSDLDNFAFGDFKNEVVCLLDGDDVSQLQLLTRCAEQTPTDVVFRLWFVGGPVSVDADAICADSAVGGRITLDEGWRSEVHRSIVLSNCRAVVCLSRGSAAGVHFAFEACASEKVVIALPEALVTCPWIEHGVTGFLCASDGSALARLLDEVRKQEAVARRVGSEARRHMSGRVPSWTSVLNELIG